MIKVKKRDGSIVEFDLAKIQNAIEKAFLAEHKAITKDMLEILSLRVTADFNRKVIKETIAVEDIQDSVEIVLIQAGYVDVARSYMDYRKKHADLRDIRQFLCRNRDFL